MTDQEKVEPTNVGDEQKAARKASLSNVRKAVKEAVGAVKGGWDQMTDATIVVLEHYLTYSDSEGARIMYNQMYNEIGYDNTLLKAFKSCVMDIGCINITKDSDASTEGNTVFRAKRKKDDFNKKTNSGKNMEPIAGGINELKEKGLKEWAKTKPKKKSGPKKDSNGDVIAENKYVATAMDCGAHLTKCAEYDANDPRVAACYLKLMEALEEIKKLEEDLSKRAAEAVAENSGILNKAA